MKYRITFTCDADACAVLIEAVKHPGITLDGMAPIVEERQHNAPRKYRNGHRDKGISGKDLVIKILKELAIPVSSESINEIFMERGFAHNSHSPNISKLLREGKIEKGSKPHTYRLPLRS